MAEVTDTAIVAKSSAASATEADLDADAGIEMKSADAGEVQVKVNGGGGSGKLTQRKLTQLLLEQHGSRPRKHPAPVGTQPLTAGPNPSQLSLSDRIKGTDDPD